MRIRRTTRGYGIVFGVLMLSVPLAYAEEGGLPGGFPTEEYIQGTAGFDFHSKWLSYGFNDNDEPVLLPTASLTFLDLLTTGVTPYMDLTDWGGNAGRGTRPFETWEVDYTADAKYVLTPDDYSILPTSVELGIGYRYEYYPPRCGYSDTQFWLGYLSFPNPWLVPNLVYERDVMYDDGTYLKLGLSHDFEMGKNATLTPSVTQGLGDRKRIATYAQREDGKRFDRAGLMDFTVQLLFIWQPFDNLTVSGYVAYTDFPFDRHVREGARRHLGNDTELTSWNFTTGLSLRIMF